MKAVVITSFGAPEVLQIQERAIPVVLNDEVLVRVKAAGVNRPDVFQREGNYPAPKGASVDIPGLEIAGIVEAVGEGVTQWHIGDKVCALVSGGGYAEYVAVPSGHCLPIPNNLNFTEAASLPETVFTVWSNVFQRGNLKSQENLLVHGGTSGIGTTAIQLAKAFGAKVFTTAGTDEKCKACLALGADICINYKESDFEKALSNYEIDIILDMVGGDYFEKNMNVLAAEGRLVYINAMQGNTVKLNIMKMMQKRISITGSTLRSRDKTFKTILTKSVYEHVWPTILNGQFKPIIYKVFPAEQATQAHHLMESSTHIGKIVLSLS
ncbi:NAD(P)H-quinone oxidoreductase [Olivibacter domesticus]|uniref:Putative NAD(P)H quinone oxidoreductase, PIG3 family n=1 Tax=Olivibacter domesticus TaxID=407022 RepID=A0A1H7INV1_OLID1|nr:NAD(P)H-quinone oxidoreductase [Olivibacter domesticus]SEK64116.1 putative NAD(P)H quinone oxidoreductase, PIG3 family [Olivibacter domesticus]